VTVVHYSKLDRRLAAMGHARHVGALSTLAECPLLPPIPTELMRHNKTSRGATSRHTQCSKTAPLFDHLVGALLELQRHVEAERLGGLGVAAARYSSERSAMANGRLVAND
jgi:hypothetical protein